MAGSAKFRLLVIDDDPLVYETAELCLPEHWEMARRQQKNFDPSEFFHAALVDIHLTGNLEKSEGLEVMKKLSQQQPMVELIAMSGDLRRDNMEGALKAGATRFLAKPLVPDEVRPLLHKIETLWSLRGVNLGASEEGVKWVGSSEASDQVRRFIANMKQESAPILIAGESGTGKEVVAQLIHASQPERPFVAINVAALSANLFESELFGHVKGAFTGAIHHKAGLVEKAHGGDLFLDEIEALSTSHQAKLLRFLESGEFQKVGATEVQKVQVRVIAATNEDLNQMVEKKQFREDLMYRLSGHKLALAPLRDRTDDIKELCQFFLGQREMTMKKSLGEDALESLKNYGWPGNVRQLKRVCEHLALMSPLPIIRAEDVTAHLYSGAAPATTSSFDLSQGLGGLIAAYERKVLEFALEHNKDVDDLAKKLQISRSSLYKKVKDHNLEIKK